MRTYMPLVRGAISLLLIASLSSFRLVTAQLQGKWLCETKSGKLDSSTTFQMNCDGYLLFKADQSLESTCLDGFFPTGTFWEISANDRLILKDSDGQAFADFEIKKLETSKLTLFRRGITYEFRKTAD